MSYNNNFQIDYVCPGFCSLCFAEIAEFNGSFEVSPGFYRPQIKLKKEDGVFKLVLKSNYRTQNVYLSDGSQMTVTLCENCVNLTPDKLPILMANETDGWKKEIEHFQAKVDYQKKLKIIDVPEMKFDEAIKATLLEVTNGSGK